MRIEPITNRPPPDGEFIEGYDDLVALITEAHAEGRPLEDEWVRLMDELDDANNEVTPWRERLGVA